MGRLLCPRAEAGAGRMGNGERPSGCGGLGGRQRLQGPHTVGSEGVPRASAPCRPSCGGRTRKGVGVPVGGPLRAVGPAAGRERCPGGGRPGPHAWVAASTGTSARGECGVVRAGRLVAGGLTGSPTRRG